MQNRQDAVLKAPFVGVIQETLRRARQLRQRGPTDGGAGARRSACDFAPACPSVAPWASRVGQPVRIRLEGRAEPIDAQISRISPALDVSSRSLIIEADVDNPTASCEPGCLPRPRSWSTRSAALGRAGRQRRGLWRRGKSVDRRRQGRAAADPHRPPRRGTGGGARRPASRATWFCPMATEGREGVVRVVRDDPADTRPASAPPCWAR